VFLNKQLCKLSTAQCISNLRFFIDEIGFKGPYKLLSNPSKLPLSKASFEPLIQGRNLSFDCNQAKQSV